MSNTQITRSQTRFGIFIVLFITVILLIFRIVSTWPLSVYDILGVALGVCVGFFGQTYIYLVGPGEKTKEKAGCFQMIILYIGGVFFLGFLPFIAFVLTAFGLSQLEARSFFVYAILVAICVISLYFLRRLYDDTLDR